MTDFIFKESYHDNMSDAEKEALALSYWSIGQSDEDGEDISWKNWCWIYKNDILRYKKGQTHGINFGIDRENYFRGWYDAKKNTISVVFPAHELRKFGNRRPSEDDIPQLLYQKLINTFGAGRPKFIVFENATLIKRSELKLLLKEIVQQILLNEREENEYYWLEPNLQFQRVPWEGHANWARNYLENMGKKLSYGDYDDVGVYNRMYELGFVRVVKVGYFDGDILTYNYKKGFPPSPQKIKAMKNFAIEKNCDTIRDDTSGRIENLLQEGIFLKETMTYKELLALTTPERKERAANVRVRSIPVSIEEGLEQWNFRYKSSPQTTVTDEPFEGHITFLKGRVERSDDAMNLECKVDCSCPDFMYRFAYNDTQKGASDIGPDSLSGCINRKPKPAYDYGEGLCKHLAALRRYLQTKILATRRSNLFEAIGDVAKQGPFNITYYD
jgi:hypothetical protein